MSQCLKMIANSENSNVMTLSQPAGMPLRCVLNPQKNASPQLKLEQILTIQHNLNFGVNTTLNLAKKLQFGFRLHTQISQTWPKGRYQSKQ